MDHFRRLRMEAQAPLANTGLITVEDSASLYQQGFQPNAAGESYTAARMAGYRSLPAKLGLAKARSGLVVTLFAMRRCVAEQLTLPLTLESLRPRYLLDVPLDVFSLKVMVLVAALPSASNVAMLSERFGADSGRIARIILVSTSAAFLTFSGAVALLQ
jgi:hypothetical protein